MFGAVIFDPDGSPIDSEAVGIATAIAAFGLHGYEVTAELFLRMVGLDVASGETVLRAALGADLPLARIKADWNALTRARFLNEGPPRRPMPPE